MIVGTAGHIDHGKTSLVKALTGVDTDRLKEEKARGITIDLGFAYWPLPNGDVIGFVDVPGHERFVHTMLAGAAGIDFALLVVAADEAVKPQTREHLAIMDLLGVKHGLVALTKADRAEPEQREAAIAEVGALLARTNLEGAAILPVSVVTGEGVEELRALLQNAASAFQKRDSQGLFRLAVDRSFTLAGAGTVVTGTVLSGIVRVGDHVTISPSGRATRIRSIHAQNQPAQQGRAGERCALNLTGEGISKDAIARGDMVLAPVLHAPTDRIDAILRVLPSEAHPIGQWFPARFHHAATDVGARIVLLDDVSIPPGGEAMVQLVLDAPIPAASQDVFVLRDTSAQRTIGGGTLLDLRAPARHRRGPERRAQLAAWAHADPSKAMAALADAAPHYFDLTRFARDRALALTTVKELAERLGLVCLEGASTIALSAKTWEAFAAGVLAALEAFHTQNPDMQGMGFERLRMHSDPRFPADIFRIALGILIAENKLVIDGSWVRLPGHEARLNESEERLWARIRPLLGEAERFRPPRVRDVAGLLDHPEADIRALCKLNSRLGRLDEIAHDHFFLRETTGEMVGIVQELAASMPSGQFTAAQFRDRVENGRKVAIQILEFFDRHGVTLRGGDLRRVNKYRLDLFRSGAASGANHGGEASPVGRPDFKSGWGREPVLGGFDSHSLPPVPNKAHGAN